MTTLWEGCGLAIRVSGELSSTRKLSQISIGPAKSAWEDRFFVLGGFGRRPSGTSGELWGARQGSGVRDQFSAYRNVEMKGGGSAKVFEKRTGGGVGGASGANQAAERGLFPEEKCEKHTSGPEGRIHFMTHTPGINPRPTARRFSSAACNAPSFLGDGCTG